MNWNQSIYKLNYIQLNSIKFSYIQINSIQLNSVTLHLSQGIQEWTK